ncbi:hypothetical protein JOM56_013017 [Amanita muscaria]
MASAEEELTPSRPLRQAKKVALEKAVWRSKKRRADALPARRTSAKRRCTPSSRKGKSKEDKRSLSDESENEPVNIPIPPAPKKPRKGKARVIQVSESEDSDSIVSVSDSNSSLGPVGEDDNIENIFDDGNTTEPDTQTHGPFINLNDVAVTAIAKRVLAERPQWANPTEGASHLFSDDNGSDPESPSARLSANKENVAPAMLAPTPSPPPPPPPPPSPSLSLDGEHTNWPYYTQLVYHQTNSGLDLGLSRQPHEIKLVIRRAIEIITERVIFEDAFPSAATRAAWIYSAILAAIRRCNEMAAGAAQHRYPRIRARVIAEPQYVQELSTMINPRIPLLRSQIKSLAINNAFRTFDLQNIEVDGVAGLTNDLKYIYPRNQYGNVQGSRPYENGAIVSTIRDFLFHNSTVETYPQRFPRGQEANHALTPSIIALAATTVAAAVDEWRTGRRIIGSFTSNIYADIYRTHMALLTKIQTDNVQGYTALLRRLYVAAASLNNGLDISPNAGSSLLDVANMAVDV